MKESPNQHNNNLNTYYREIEIEERQARESERVCGRCGAKNRKSWVESEWASEWVCCGTYTASVEEWKDQKKTYTNGYD